MPPVLSLSGQQAGRTIYVFLIHYFYVKRTGGFACLDSRV